MTMIQLIACIGMIAGLFMVLNISPREMSDSIFSRLTSAPGSSRNMGAAIKKHRNCPPLNDAIGVWGLPSFCYQILHITESEE